MFRHHLPLYTTLEGAAEYVSKGTCLAKREPDASFRMKIAVPQDVIRSEENGILTIALEQN